MSENDKTDQIIRRPGDRLVRPSGSGSSLASRGLALLNQGKAKAIENVPPSPSPVHKVGEMKSIILPGGVEMEFSYLPAGEFWMGSPEGEEERWEETPFHPVIISKPFWIGKFQVNQTQWRIVVESLPKVEIDLKPNPSKFIGDALPVEQVSWFDCQEFLLRLNAYYEGSKFRFPTEAQWEYACRAETTTLFSIGERVSINQVNFNGWYTYEGGFEGRLGQVKTVPVGSLNKPNRWGLHDMHGNVREWCEDWYGAEFYKESPTLDPVGPSAGEFRVGLQIDIAHFCTLRTRKAVLPPPRCTPRDFYRTTQSFSDRFIGLNSGLPHFAMGNGAISRHPQVGTILLLPHRGWSMSAHGANPTEFSQLLRKFHSWSGGSWLGTWP